MPVIHKYRSKCFGALFVKEQTLEEQFKKYCEHNNSEFETQYFLEKDSNIVLEIKINNGNKGKIGNS